jgi:hypothetical protein
MATQTKTLSVGSNLNQLDIYLNVDGVAINASGISFEVYDAASVLAVSGVPTNPSEGKYLGSGVVPAGFANGDWRIDWLIIPTGNSQFTASEEFCVQPLNVAFTLSPPGEVVTTIYDKIRIDMGDPDGTLLGDSFLKRVVQKAITRLNNKLGLAPTTRGPTGIEGQFGGRRIRVIPITIDFSAGTINPPGDEYEDLLILQSEYILATSEIATMKRLNASAGSGFGLTAATAASIEGIDVTNADGTRVSIAVSRLTTRASLMRFHVEELRRELDDAVKKYLNRATANYTKMVY